MRLLLPLALICLLAGQAQSRVLLQGSTQFIQWGLALPGRCRSFPANYNVTLNEALRTDVDSPLKRAYGEECQAVIPTYPNQPDAPDSPLPCADYLSPLDDKDYALFRLTVRLDCGTPAGTPPPDDEIQNRLRSLLNKYWNENGTPNQCTGPCGFLDHPATFASIIRVLGNNVCARSRGAEMKPSTVPPSFGRVPLEQIYPCIGKVPSSPSPSPSSPSPSPSSPSPSPSSPSPSPSSPSPSPSPPSTTCGNTGNGQPFVCVAPFVNKPNNQNITNPSVTACCECTNTASVEAFDVNGTLVQCLNPADPCPEQFPITVRPFTGTPPVACLARGPNTVCPAGFPFPFFATIGNSTVLTNCWPQDILNSSNDVCQITIASGPFGSTGRYGIPVSASFTSARPSGCLLDGSSLCPSTFPFTNMTATTPVVACFSPQTTCNAPGGTPPATFTARVFSAGTIVGCADITTTCPPAFPIEASTSATANPSQCYATNMGCTVAFSFSLYSGNTLDRCVQPIPNVANCAGGNFGTFTGAALYSTTTASGFTGCASAASCPTAFPTFYQNSTGSTERCSLPISTECSLQFSGQFGISVRNATTQAIAGCRSGSSCGSDDVIVSETYNSTVLQCLAPGTTSCPSGLFPIYSGGSVNGAARLLRCVNAINAQNCDAVGQFTAEVFGNIAGVGPVVGCMLPQGTPCPTSSPFAILSNVDTVASCSAAGATCDASATRLVAANGAAIGCIVPAIDTCPTGVGGQAYNYPFFLRGLADGTARMAECRSTPSTLPANCDTFGAFSVPVYATTDLASTNNLVGCMRQGQRCTVPGLTFSILAGTDGELAQCKSDGITACNASPFPLDVLEGETNGALLGCMAATVTRCGNSAFPFGIYSVAGMAPTDPVALGQCRTTPDISVTADCTALGLAIDFNIELLSNSASLSQSNWVGCTQSGARCPTEFSVFGVSSNGVWETCLATGTTCNAPTQIPIIDSLVANTLTPVIGCMPRALTPGQQCPNDNSLDQQIGGGAYDFFLAGANNALKACYVRGVNSCSSTQIRMYEQTGSVDNSLPAVPTGCLEVATPNRQTECPVTNIVGLTFNFELLGPGPAGAELVVGCVAPAGTVTDATTCRSGIGRIGTTSEFPVMINDNILTSVAVADLRACYSGTVCPTLTNPFPIWTVNGNPIGGRQGQAILFRCLDGPGTVSAGSLTTCNGASTDPGANNAIVLNDVDVPDGNNPASDLTQSNLIGCVASASIITSIQQCPAGFPVATVDIAGSNAIRTCRLPNTVCATGTNAADYRFRLTAQGEGTLGCTNGANVGACDTYAGTQSTFSNPTCTDP